jgi:hypothetical protein
MFKGIGHMANGHGGARPGSGPKKGTKYCRKERDALAVQADKAMATLKDGMGAVTLPPGSTLTKTTLDAYNMLCKIAIVFYNRGAEQQQLKSAGQPHDDTRLTESFEQATYVLREIIKYQRPQLRSVLIQGDPLGLMGLAPAKTVNEVEVIPPKTDPATATRMYQRLVTAAIVATD